MTTIKLRLRNQLLFAPYVLPEIASGGNNENKLKILLDPSSFWNELACKAVVYQNESDKSEIEIVNNEAVIPKKATANAGVLNIVIYGEKTVDGVIVKKCTSNIFQLKIVEGIDSSGQSVPEESNDTVIITGVLLPTTIDNQSRGAIIPETIPRGSVLIKAPYGTVKFENGVVNIDGANLPQYYDYTTRTIIGNYVEPDIFETVFTLD